MRHPLRTFGIPFLLLISALQTGLAPPASAETLTNTQFNFTLTVPDGFVQFPATGTALYNFATSDPAKGVPDAVVSVQRLNGTIGREHLDLKSTGLPDAKLFVGQWKSFPVDVVTAHISSNGVSMAMRGAQIPLQREAVQILVVVPAQKEATAEPILNRFLAGLDGPSNWTSSATPAPADPAPLTPREQGEQFGRGLATLLIVALLAIFGISALLKHLRKTKAPPK